MRQNLEDPAQTDTHAKTDERGLVVIESLDRRNEIATRIKEEIDAGIQTQGGMSTWWLQAERAYLNMTPSTQTQIDQGPNDPGYQVFNMPLTQTRVDMLAAQVTTVVAKQDPLMTDTSEDETIAEARQKLLHRVWSDAKFGMAIAKAATICGIKDMAVYRVCPGLLPGTVRIDTIDPQDWAVYPALIDGIQAASTVGHRFNRRRIVVETKQRKGEYYETQDLQTSTIGDHDPDQEQVHTMSEMTVSSPERNNELVELWDCIVRLDLDDDGNEQLYRATIDYVGSQLLALEPYKFSYIWYFRSFFIGSPKYFYSGSSVARNLDPCQTAKNNLFSAFYGGAMSAAMPKVYGPPLDDGEKFTKTGFGDYVPTEGGVTPFAPGGQFNGSPFPQMLQIIERDADMVARVSQNTQGAQAQGATTATEQAIIAAGVAVGLEMFISNFTSEFAEMATHTMELIAAEYDNFEMRYGVEPVQPEASAQGALPLLAQTGAIGTPDNPSSPEMKLPSPTDMSQAPTPESQIEGNVRPHFDTLITGAPTHVL
jgi:hypothetical protein